jgi:HEAT repeat protein
MEYPLGLPFSDRDFQYVTLAVLVVLACAVAFTLAAAWLRAANNRKQLRWARLQGQWEPVIIRVLAGEMPESQLRSLVPKKDERYFVGFLLRYARRLKGVEHDAVLRLAVPYLSTIARDLGHRSPELRARALQTLGELSILDYSNEFLQALNDPSPLVAMNAAHALARHYQPAHAVRLIRCLERFEEWNIRYLAAMLANMGPESAQVLRDAFRDRSRPPRIRAVIALTLASLNDAGSVDLATQVIEAERQTDLVIAALTLIEKVGGSEQLPAVRRLLESTDFAVRARAVTTLAALGTAEDTARIRSGLDDESNWVALHAAQGLRDMGRVDLLEELASSDHPRAVAAQEMLWEMRA